MAARRKRARSSSTAARKRSPARRKSPPAPIEPSSASPFFLKDDAIEDALVDPSMQGVLEDYFGPAEYAELRRLAVEARTTRASGPRVWILPGIMGSKIGRARALLWDDVVWLDPIDIARGRMRELILPDRGRYSAIGVLLFSYLKLKLRLRAAGFNVSFQPYDWRKSVDELGDDLAQRLENEDAASVHLVCHSMGGLVARAAALLVPHDWIGRVVMLGTPNFGSIAAVPSLRGRAPLVRRLARWDLWADADELAQDVLSTFPGLYQLLPAPGRTEGIDLYERTTWPADAAVPSQALLTRAAEMRATLANGDERFFMIAGVDKETLTSVRIVDGRFQYERSRDGDGTVPRTLAELPGVPTYYVEAEHGGMPNNARIAKATIDLLRQGTTDELPREYAAPARRAFQVVEEADLRDPYEDRPLRMVSRAERLDLVREFVAASRVESAASQPWDESDGPLGTQASDSLRDVVVSRRRSHSIELCLAHGSLTEAHVRALVLGLFREVDPGGAAEAIDRRMDGAVQEFMARRMFSAQVGEVLALPCGRHPLYAESALFVGMGDFDVFDGEVATFIAENVVRSCALTHVEDFASVLFGTGSGLDVEAALTYQLRGYFKALHEVPESKRVRRITICEIDDERFEQMKREAYRLASTDLFGDVRVTFDEQRLEPAPRYESRGQRELLADRPSAIFLNVRYAEPATGADIDSLLDNSTDKVVVHSSVLTSGGSAAVLSGYQTVSTSKLGKLLAQVEKRAATQADLERIGTELASSVLSKPVRGGLARALESEDRHLVVVHDAAGSRIPWETLRLGRRQPALGAGMSRRYVAENLSVAKWLESRRMDKTLGVLLVVNPTEDLDGAKEEGERMCALFREAKFEGRTRVDVLRGGEATRGAVLEALRSGRYDVVHYAGHAFFDKLDRTRSGLLCHGHEVLTGWDVATLSSLPALLVMNACESGRVRSAAKKKLARLDPDQRAMRNASLAESFLRGGVANYIGTYWEVSDEAAVTFATTLYRGLLNGQSIGTALLAARREVRKQARSIDWANYVHYGSHEFRLKT